MLSVFTDEYGIIKAVSHGARRTKSRTGASSQFLCFAEFEMYQGGDIWTIKSINPLDNFFPVQEDIVKLALCTYFADITYALTDQNNPDIDVLRLLLNTLYACAYQNVPIEQLKAAYELRLMALSGFMPAVGQCMNCGETGYNVSFDLESGGMLCEKCRYINRHEKIKLTPAAYKAIYYIITCDMKRLFSFHLDEESMCVLAKAAERYLLVHTDREFRSLSYYKSLNKIE